MRARLHRASGRGADVIRPRRPLWSLVVLPTLLALGAVFAGSTPALAVPPQPLPVCDTAWPPEPVREVFEQNEDASEGWNTYCMVLATYPSGWSLFVPPMSVNDNYFVECRDPDDTLISMQEDQVWPFDECAEHLAGEPELSYMLYVDFFSGGSWLSCWWSGASPSWDDFGAEAECEGVDDDAFRLTYADWFDLDGGGDGGDPGDGGGLGPLPYMASLLGLVGVVSLVRASGRM